MDTIQINPLIVSVNPTAEAIIHPIDPTEHGGGVKKVLAVVATVAMPFVAAPIASAIGLSGAISAAAGTVLSAGAAATVGGAVGGFIGKLFCDIRLKEDIAPLCKSEVNDVLSECAFFVKDLNECS